MKLTPIDPARVFETGRGAVIRIKDCARIALEPDEQVTFVTESGAEYDVTRKDWGFYATPSLNGRLMSFGLRAALVKSYVDKYYVFLIEQGKEDLARRYLDSEANVVARWLDNDRDLSEIQTDAAIPQAEGLPNLRCPCGINRLATVHTYFAPPEGETKLSLASGTPYRRELFRCSVCGHFLSFHRMHLPDLYAGEYVNATYGDEAGLRKTFDRIVALPPEASDNAGRVRAIQQFFQQQRLSEEGRRSVLDVGSGLCVFLHAMTHLGWECTALDPDPRAARHAENVVGASSICGDFNQMRDLGRFDLITFNKVLEHVTDPVAMLAAAVRHLSERGVVYVELPDGESASQAGFAREEFFIEHHHVFSAASFAHLVAKAGFALLAMERVREPSSKFTLRAFLGPARV